MSALYDAEGVRVRYLRLRRQRDELIWRLMIMLVWETI